MATTRQVASLLELPELLHESREADTLRFFPKDAIARARVLSKAIGSVGAYSHSMGAGTGWRAREGASHAGILALTP